MGKSSDLAAALRHRYRVEPNGEYVPGVTTAIGILDKPALKWTSSKIAAETAVANSRRKRTIVPKHRAKLIATKGKTPKAERDRALGTFGTDLEIYVHWCRGEFQRQWNAKADRGTRVHDVAEAWSKGQTVTVPRSDSGYVDALEAFYRDYRPKFRLVECVVLSPTHRYGGRFDGIVELDGPDAQGLFLIDWKTGSKYDLEVALQAEAYSRGLLGIYDEDGTLTGFDPLPDTQGCRTIYLHEDGTYEVSDPFATISRDVAFEAFLACLKVYEVTKQINLTLKEGEES